MIEKRVDGVEDDESNQADVTMFQDEEEEEEASTVEGPSNNSSKWDKHGTIVLARAKF